MYILLSSCATKRYRDDILRCLAAPLGAEIQFRYNADIVGATIHDRVRPSADGRRPASSSNWDAPGLVCNVDIDTQLDAQGTHPLIPVRQVKVRWVKQQGSTFTVSLTMEDFAYTKDVKQFTTEVMSRGGDRLPRRARSDAEHSDNGALWFLNISQQPETLTVRRDIEAFERVTTDLSKVTHFRQEPFFWTTLKLHRGVIDERTDTQVLEAWPDSIKLDTVYSLLIYVFRPLDESWPNGLGQLLLKSEAQLHRLSPPDILVDSPYDLKHWVFKIKSPVLAFPDDSWLQIGHEAVSVSSLAPDQPDAPLGKDEAGRELRKRLSDKSEWSITLPLRLSFSPVRFFAATTLLGVLFAAPAITVAWRAPGGNTDEKVISSLIAALFGVAAAILAAFQIRRPL